jgi:hypothetical protein
VETEESTQARVGTASEYFCTYWETELTIRKQENGNYQVCELGHQLLQCEPIGVDSLICSSVLAYIDPVVFTCSMFCMLPASWWFVAQFTL